MEQFGRATGGSARSRERALERLLPEGRASEVTCGVHQLLLLREPAELADGLAHCATPPRWRRFAPAPPGDRDRFGSSVRRPRMARRFGFYVVRRRSRGSDSCKIAKLYRILQRRANPGTPKLAAPMRDKAPETYTEKVDQLEHLRHEAIHAGSEQAVAKQHERGKYTAR